MHSSNRANWIGRGSLNSMSSSSNKPVAIIAGNGGLPFETANVLLAKGRQVHLVGISGEVGSSIENYAHTMVEWGQIGKLFRVLKQHSVEEVLLIGGVDKRPDINLRKMDWGGLRTLPQILAIMLAGDNTVLTSVVGIFESKGLKVKSMIDLAPELLVVSGANTSIKPSRADQRRLQQGADVVAALGRFDIGQGAVIVGDRAVAVEGVEGTDSMLRRVAELKQIGRLSSKRGGVLVKRAKPNQNLRADLPTIGPQTIENLHRAGLVGVGVEAGKTLIADRERTLELALQSKIFICGIDLQDEDLS